MNITQFQEYLQKVDIDNITFSNHFVKRAHERNLDNLKNKANLHDMFSREIPERIVNQENNKFKVVYTYNNKYDVVMVISVKSTNKFSISLVTCFLQEVERRMK
ncbi:hypothetical protein [Methanosalsum natronophilum]|uniref:hypothetical protein n=1 Tax=Methanosalsum natronophilum TaxID=768733 RepID=UPI002166CB53|nr:hypothetical protein [Methanosalsum natronophilum]MCS3923412.1 serine kinase of HPr protein (carbohydrate metabolism regulator) [Methanosalsum natronophilum]